MTICKATNGQRTDVAVPRYGRVGPSQWSYANQIAGTPQ